MCERTLGCPGYKDELALRMIILVVITIVIISSRWTVFFISTHHGIQQRCVLGVIQVNHQMPGDQCKRERQDGDCLGFQEFIR